jgi:hypothetical protein
VGFQQWVGNVFLSLSESFEPCCGLVVVDHPGHELHVILCYIATVSTRYRCIMQVAILAVLILIAVILAPWLIGVVVALAAAYGVYIVALGVLAAVALPLIWLWIAMIQKKNEGPPITTGQKVPCKNCQAEMPDYIVFCHNCHGKM